MPPAFVDFETQSKRQQQNPSSYKSRTKPRLPKRRHVAKNPNLDFLYRAMNDPISGSFVFGTSDRGLNLPKKENEMKKSNDGFVLGDQNYGFVSDDRSNFENLKKTEVVSGLSSGFVFGTSLKNPNLNVEMGKGSNGFVSSDLNNCENLKKTEPDSGLSSGFVFGTSLEKPNLNMEMGKSSNGFVSSDLNNGPISSSFVFDTSECGFNKPNKENEMKERNDRSNFENLKKTELGSGLSSGFVFGTSLKNPNLNVEMGKGSNGLVSSDLNNCENLKKTEPNSGLSSGFVFGTSLEKPNLNMEMGKSSNGFVSSDLNNGPISSYFVFGTSECGFNKPNKENEMKERNDRSNFENLKKTELGSGLSSGFVFGTSLKSPNLNVEMGKGSNGLVSSDLNNCENLKKTEPNSGLSSGFVFGTSLEKPNLNMEMGKSSNGFVSSDLNNGPISSSFVFGTNECGFNKPNKENEMKERNDRSNFENLKKTELGSGLSSGFVFGTSLKNPNLNVEMGKGSNGLVSSDLNNCENLKKTEPNSGLSSGFVFGTSLEKPNLNMEMGKSSNGFVSSDLNNGPISSSFVFGTSECGFNKPNKENEMKERNDRSNFKNLKKTELGSGLSSGFVFGTSLKNPNLNVEMGKGSNGLVSSDLNNCENLKKTEPNSDLSSGFVFGTSLEKPNLNMEMGKSSNGFVSSDLNNGPISSSFVFGTSECGFNKPNKENEMKERNDRSNFENLKKTELGSGLSSEFVFGTSLKNPNLNVEMGKGSNGLVSSDLNNCENLKKTEPNSGLSSGFVFGTSLEKPNLNVEMGIKNDGFVSSDLNSGSNVKNPGLVSGLSNGFVFGASGSGLENPSLNVEMKSTIDGFVSDSKKTDFVTGLSNGFVSDSKKTDFVTGLSKGFVFGKSGSVLENPSLNVETKQSNTGFANLNSKCNEPNKKDEPGRSFSGGFVFSTGNSSFNTRKPEPDRRNPRKLGSIFKKASTQSNGNEDRKVFENCAEPQKEKGDDVFVFGSSKKVNSSSTDCENLSGDINKLNAKDCRSHTSFVNNKQNFVFGKNVCAPRVNITDKLSDDMSRLNVTESNEKDKLGDVKKPLVNPCTLTDPVFVFEGSGKSGVAVSEKSIKFGHLFETFKEKPPTIAKERSSNNAFVGICTPKSFTSQAGQGQSFAQFEDQVNDYTKSKEKFSQSYFSADLFNVEAFSIGRVEGKNNFSFSTPSRDASSSFAENLATSFSKHPDYSEKSRSVKNKKWKKLSHKSRKVDPIQQQPSKNNEGSQQKAESPGHFSPMDFSPYQDDQCASSSNERADTNKEESSKLGQGNVDFSKNFWERFAAEYPFEQAETVGRSSGTGQVSTNNNDDGAAADTFSKKSVSKEEKECTSRKDDGTERNSGSFSMSNEDNVSATKRRSMRKYRTKVGSSPNNIDPSCQADSSYSHLYTDQNKERSTINSQRPATVWRVKNSAKGDEKHSNHQPTGFMKVKNNVEAQNACEKWRIRGNQAYEKGQSSKAEEYYTKGIDSFVNKGSPEGSIEPLVLCYSNRAAARMLCGRMREALSDCVMADSLDPSFQKVQLRAANCHLALGEIAEACQYFNKYLESNGYICLDRRSAIEAASGLQKAQNLASCLSHCAELLRQKTLAAANSALESISSVFPTSSYSEKLLELKGEALFMLQRYKEAIQLCETTLDLAEKNFAIIAGDNNSVNINDTNSKYSTIKLWRWRLMSKSYFHLGKLELALEFLEKQEALTSFDERSNTEDLSIPIATTVRELLHHKNAGNRAFQSGKHTEAVEHYSAAVSGRIESRPFAAVCFCNRAAAHQALGQVSDAISDCSIAIALDGTYSKAVSRRATLHEKIRDYGNATNDLQILISLLKEQSQKDKINKSAGDDPSSNNHADELRQAHIRLSSIEEKAKKGLPLDHYLILGVKSTDEASELKKAYRRAALRHHPDKAGQFLVRGDTGDDGRLWKDLCEEIQRDADRLFKLIGEAYAVLSDPNKRSEYDLQEELRNVRKENRNQDSTRSYDFYGSPSKNRRNNGRYSQESWKTYGYSPSRW